MLKRYCILFLCVCFFVLTGCQPKEVLPPVRVSSQGMMLPGIGFSKTLQEQYEKADIVARIRIGDWIGENNKTCHTFYEAEILELYKGNEERETIRVCQEGCSASTVSGYPLFTAGNTLLVFLVKSYTGNSYGISVEMDAATDEAGNVYYMARYPSDDEYLYFEKCENYREQYDLYRYLKNSFTEIDPLLAERSHCAVFAEKDIEAVLADAHEQMLLNLETQEPMSEDEKEFYELLKEIHTEFFEAPDAFLDEYENLD